MKLLTPGQFTDAISKDLAHRKRDLTNLNTVVAGCREHQLSVMSSSAVCMLYAHWEGFVKYGGTCFANFVFYQGIAPEHLSNGVIASAVRDKFTELRATKKVSLCREFVASIRHPNTGIASLNWKQAVETYNNLKLDVLMEVLALLGCDPAFYLTKKGIIDDRLVRYRNSIAHTGYSDFDPSDFGVMYNDTIGLLDRFRDDLEDAVTNKTYRN